VRDDAILDNFVVYPLLIATCYMLYLKNVLSKIKKHLRSETQFNQFSCIDLRNEPMGPMQAYYEFNNRPCIINTDPEHCRWFGASGLSYSKDSLHPYICTLADYQNNGHSTYKDSYLEWYWNTWQPSNLAEYFRIHAEPVHSQLLNTPPIHNISPWSPSHSISYMQKKGWLNRKDYRALCESGSIPARSCGPKPDWFGAERFKNLISVYKSIKLNGYCEKPPETVPFGDQHLVGKCMVRSGEVRVLIANGQHRASSLVTLGYEKLPVIFFTQNNRGPDIIRKEDVVSWPLVQKGIFTKEQGLSIFDHIFDGIPPREIVNSIIPSRFVKI